MTNSVMIEIDEATKGIMEDLQSSLSNNIEGSLSAGFRQQNDEQARFLISLQTTLTSKINQIEAEIASSKKPVSRIARDLEETLLSINKLEKSLDEKFKNAEQVQAENVLELCRNLSNAIEESGNTQQKVLNESMQHFSSNANIGMLEILKQVKESKNLFAQLISETKEKLGEQYRLTEKVQLEIKSSTIEMLSIKENFDYSIVEQQKKFQAMQEVIDQSIATTSARQVAIFDEQMKNINQRFNQAVEEVKMVHSKDLNRMNTLQQQKFEDIVARLLEKNATVSEQLLKTNEKLEALHQEVEYRNLPFYKKRFTQKEGTL